MELASSNTTQARLHPELGGLPKPSFLGTPDQCREQLREIRHRYATDELVIQSLTRDAAARRLSYELLAEVFELPARAGEIPPA